MRKGICAREGSWQTAVGSGSGTDTDYNLKRLFRVGGATSLWCSQFFQQVAQWSSIFVSRVVFYHVLSNVKPKRSMSACSKVALIGKHIILIHFFDFPGRRKPPPRHASTPFCGVAMLTLEFEQLEVPCSERGRTHITFHCLSLRHSWTVKPDIQQVELILVVFFVGGCPCNVSSVTTTASFGPTM